MVTVGLLHPGAMGSSLGVALRAGGHTVRWASGGRSDATRARADAADLQDVGDLAALVVASDVVLSICPPAAALDVAQAVADTGFAGIFVDANAVAAATAQRIAEVVAAAGASMVDGSVVGPPATRPGTTRLYLSGDRAAEVAALFDGTNVGAVALSAPVGAASTLKMAYAAWTKGSGILLVAVAALAERVGVMDALRDEWARSQPGLAERLDGARRTVDEKGWRWSGEMREIAATLEAAGLPSGFHLAAAELLEAWGDGAADT